MSDSRWLICDKTGEGIYVAENTGNVTDPRAKPEVLQAFITFHARNCHDIKFISIDDHDCEMADSIAEQKEKSNDEFCEDPVLLVWSERNYLELIDRNPEIGVPFRDANDL